MPATSPLSPSERVMATVTTPSTGCWITGLTQNGKGYGAVSVWRTSTQNWGLQLAHRVVYEAMNGPIPKGLFVCHTCDVRNCVRPAHLFLGTARDNTRDMMSKGRHRTPFEGSTC